MTIRIFILLCFFNLGVWEQTKVDSFPGYIIGNSKTNIAFRDFKSNMALIMKFDSIEVTGDSVPKLICSSKNLKYLHVEGPGVHHLPNEIGKLTQLKELIVNFFILDLPPGISGLKNLKKLHLGKVYDFKNFPPEIGSLVSLEYLSVYQSRLEKIPAEIGKLINLKELRVDGGDLTQLPEEIKNCTKLQKLVLMNNKLSKVEQERIQKLLPNCKMFFDGNPKK